MIYVYPLLVAVITVSYPSPIVGRTVTTGLLLLTMPIVHTAWNSLIRMSALRVPASVLSVAKCVVSRILPLEL